MSGLPSNPSRSTVLRNPQLYALDRLPPDAERQREKRRFWTEQEIVAVKEFYCPGNAANFTLAELAVRLNRTQSAIADKAFELGVTYRRGKAPKTEVAKSRMAAAQRKRAKDPLELQRRSAAQRTWIKERGHPRGFLGKKHTTQAREAVSKANKGMRVPNDRTMRRLKTNLAKYGKLAPAEPYGSWRAGWREIGGKRIYARSRWEANYARYLEWLKSLNEIRDWHHEAETFWFEAVKRGARSYLPDFKVELLDGGFEYHEVKGWMDRRSRTKIKRMAKYHPSVKLIVRDASWFKKNNPTLSQILQGWETKHEQIKVAARAFERTEVAIEPLRDDPVAEMADWHDI